nr:undecaprenyl-phosphate glucose phosphotransferase [Halomonas sp. 1513]
MRFSDRYPAQIILPLVDAVALFASGLLAHWLRFGHMAIPERIWLAMGIMALLLILLNTQQGGYKRWQVKSRAKILLRQIFVWALVAVIAASLIYFAHAAERFSRLWVGMTLLFSFILACGFRLAAQWLLRRARRQGKALVPVFLVGPGAQLVRVGEGMRNSPADGYSIAGVYRLRRESLTKAQLDRLRRRIVASQASEVWICVPFESGQILRDIFHALRNETAEVRFIPDFQGMLLLNHRMSEVAGHMSIDLSVTPIDGVSRIVKRLEDLVLGSVISLLILPVCVAIAIAIKLTSPGPVLFKQYRTGANGHRFKVYKFRSMAVHQERGGQVTQASRGDPRITRLGAFLRRTSLDELPQFYNVLQGRMSIVGPRPHALSHNDYYQDIVESYMKRHKVNPGITGWAQVNGLRGETDTDEKMERRVAADLWYIDNWSLWLDLKIIALTIFKGFINPNAY